MICRKSHPGCAGILQERGLDRYPRCHRTAGCPAFHSIRPSSLWPPGLSEGAPLPHTLAEAEPGSWLCHMSWLSPQAALGAVRGRSGAALPHPAVPGSPLPVTHPVLPSRLAQVASQLPAVDSLCLIVTLQLDQ